MISANAAMTGSYDYSEVARSVVIAIAASYAALDLAGRITAASGRIRLAWLGGGAAAMGIGIWPSTCLYPSSTTGRQFWHHSSWRSSRPRSRCMLRAAKKWDALRP